MVIKVAMPGKFQFRMVPAFQTVLFQKENEIHYIGGSESCLRLFCRTRKASAIERLGKTGSEEASLLIEHNLRLVVYIAKKFDNTGVGVEDLISIGTIGLIKAINTFVPEKKIKLATYASRCIENEIHDVPSAEQQDPDGGLHRRAPECGLGRK